MDINQIINTIFTIVIVVLAIIELKLIQEQSEKSIKGSILAFGILGTFVGIFIGLQDFNIEPAQLLNSISQLIKGLTFAFYTSILGMFVSIALTLWSKYISKIEKKDDDVFELFKIMAKNSTATLELLKTINSNIEKNHLELLPILTNIENIENKLNSFINYNNQDVNIDILKDINKKMLNQISLLSGLKNSIDALSKDNFTNKNQNGSDNVSKSFISSMSNVSSDLLELKDTLLDGFRTLDSGFKFIVDSNNRSFEININKLSSELKNMFLDFNRILDTALDNLSQKSANEISMALKWSVQEFNNSMLEKFGDNFKILDKNLDKMLHWQEDTLKSSVEKLSITIQDSSNNLSKSLSETVKDFSEDLNSSIINLETSLKETVTNHNKYIENYSNLTISNISSISEELNLSFINFNRILDMALENLSEKSANEIAMALQWSLKQFNSHMLDNLGENFKQLDLSVVKMLSWQENYKNIIEESENRLSKAIEVISNFEQIISKHSEIENVYYKLEKIITTLDNQIIVQTKNLDAFTNISNEAITSIPNINLYFNSLKTQLENTLKSNENNFNKYDLFLRDSMKNTELHIKDSVGNLGENLKILDKQMTQITNKFGLEYEAYIEAIKKILQQANSKRA